MPKKEEKETQKTEKEISKIFFGLTGTDSVFQFTLINKNGMEVRLLNYGGTVTHILTPDKNGKLGDVILGFDSLSGYLQTGNPYFGCLVGRYANRIANAKFSLDGKTYTLAANNGANSLHGGIKGYDKVIWNVKSFDDKSLSLSYNSKNGEEGYPGNLTVNVIYSLEEDNSFRIKYEATTDKPTPVNLTNHCYFNLSAGSDSTILDHELMLQANEFTPVNEQLIPTGKIESVMNTPMNFTNAKKIRSDISKVNGGYDHNWVLNKKNDSLQWIGSLYHAASGRLMEFATTEPGIQFYSGNFLNGTLINTKAGKIYVKHAGLCLETQHFPDSPNQSNFPNTILKPGETYSHETVYKFSVK
ncbi:MAG TPA: aldose epimerase family protein [Chitinophagaceae bacterium]|nr:aldose epimerase family protein [Chitinophagaceae bacterium]